MNVEAFIGSGALENYVMGFCSDEEKEKVEQYEAQYPQVAVELAKIRGIFEEYLLANQITPSCKVKLGIMEKVYQQQANADPSFPPLLKEEQPPVVLDSWIAQLNIAEPGADFGNLYMQELPSTPFVTNFMVWAKEGHDTEAHEDFVEYLYIVKGSCTMYYEDGPKHYHEGQVIYIPPHVPHKAVVTSSLPMVAFVQRQACA